MSSDMAVTSKNQEFHRCYVWAKFPQINKARMYKVDLYFERRQRRDLFASKEAAIVGRTLKRLNLLSKRKCCSACSVPADVLLSLYVLSCEAALFHFPMLQKGQLFSCKYWHPDTMQFPSPSRENLLFFVHGKKYWFYYLQHIICNFGTITEGNTN